MADDVVDWVFAGGRDGVSERPAWPPSRLDDDNVDNLSVNTDGCNCRLGTGRTPVTICWEPEDHFVREITVAGLVAPLLGGGRFQR
jgi:hypothetical protein